MGLYPAPHNDAGQPVWILHDPVANRFFRISWQSFEILSRWQVGSPGDIADAVREQTTLSPDAEEVMTLARFLASHHLLQNTGQQGTRQLLEIQARRRTHWLTWLLKNYLFVRIPLIRPDRFLEQSLPLIRWIYSRGFLMLTLMAGLLGVMLIIRQWDTFLGTFPWFFSLEGMLMFALALSLAKILHEMGHAWTAKHFGCRVPSMGIAFLVMWPVLYTDTTEAWKLSSRKARLAIGAAGMAAELALAAYATLLWSFLPDGPVKSAAFLLATTTWIMTLLVNLNPLMRFDGYYLLSDWLGIANLQDRAFALARWRLRELLFGLAEPAPEQAPAQRYRIMLIYAYATWIYRFFLFLGIAILVYHFFFKALGIFLMIVELAWFIGRPIMNEFKEWYKRGNKLMTTRHTHITLLSIALILIALITPWQARITAPAIWRAEQQSTLYNASEGQLAEVYINVGEKVSRGQPLLQIHSPDLSHAIAQGERRLEALNWQVSIQGLDPLLRERSQVAIRELSAESSAQLARRAEQEELILRAPFDGIIMELANPLTLGSWLSAREWIGVIADPRVSVIEAYVDESDLHRLQEGRSAHFHPDDPARPVLPLTLISIDPTATRELREQSLASTHGGQIAVRQSSKGSLIPEKPIYRILLASEEALVAPSQIVRGVVKLDGEKVSLLNRFIRFALGVLIRESGF